MYRYLKSNSRVTLVFQAEKKIQINQGIWAPARFAISYYGNSVFLLSEREGRTGNIWLMVTTYGLRCA